MGRRTPPPPPKLVALGDGRPPVDLSGIPDVSNLSEKFPTEHRPRNGFVLLTHEPEKSKLAIPGARPTSQYLVVLAVAKDVEDLAVGDLVSAVADSALVVNDGGPAKRFLVHESAVLSVVTRVDA